MLRIRRARSCSDLEDVRCLDLEVMGADDPVDWLAGSVWWLAFDGAKPVAYAGLTDWPYGGDDAVFLCRAGVLPRWRGLGLQRRLIRTRVAWARRQGRGGAFTYTMPDNTASACNLVRCGFLPWWPGRRWAGDDVAYWLREW